MLEPITERPQPVVLLRGTFSQKLRIYLFFHWTTVIVVTVIGIVLLPLWLVIGPLWIKRYHATLRCEVTDRNVVIGKGLLFRRELTIPIDKIQDRGGSVGLHRPAAWISGSPLVDHAAARSGSAK